MIWFKVHRNLCNFVCNKKYSRICASNANSTILGMLMKWPTLARVFIKKVESNPIIVVLSNWLRFGKQFASITESMTESPLILRRNCLNCSTTSSELLFIDFRKIIKMLTHHRVSGEFEIYQSGTVNKMQSERFSKTCLAYRNKRCKIANEWLSDWV